MRCVCALVGVFNLKKNCPMSVGQFSCEIYFVIGVVMGDFDGFRNRCI